MQLGTYKFMPHNCHYALIFKAGNSIQEFEFYTQTTGNAGFRVQGGSQSKAQLAVND
jgi:hypothetical protein